jgi:hypothetical protein
MEFTNNKNSKPNDWYINDEKFHTYWLWHGLYTSKESIKNLQKERAEKRQSSYLNKQILLSYFKNFFLFPIWFLRILTPWYMKGENNIWTNLQTIFKSKEFKPLRFDIFSQVIFIAIFSYFIYLSIHYYSRAAAAFGEEEQIEIIGNTKVLEESDIIVNTSDSETFITIPIAEDIIINNVQNNQEDKLKKIKKQVETADSNLDLADSESSVVVDDLGYKKVLNLLSGSEGVVMDIQNKKEILFEDYSLEEVNNLFIKVVEHLTKRKIVLDKIKNNLSSYFSDLDKQVFQKVEDINLNQSNLVVDNLLQDERFVILREYLSNKKYSLIGSVE